MYKMDILYICKACEISEDTRLNGSGQIMSVQQCQYMCIYPSLNILFIIDAQ